MSIPIFVLFKKMPKCMFSSALIFYIIIHICCWKFIYVIFIFRLVVEFLITTQHKLPISFKFICFSFSLSNQYKSSIFEKLSPISQANFLLTVLHIPAQHNADDSKVVLSLKKECIFYIFSNCLQCFKFLSTFVSDFLFFHFSIPL